MKKEFIFLGIIYTTSMILIGCGGNKGKEGNGNSNVKSEKRRQIMKEVITNYDSAPIYLTTVINYDTNGKITEEIHFDKGNKLSYRDQFTYNEYGDMVEEKRTQNDRESSQKTVYFYDSNRKLIKEIKSINTDVTTDVSHAYYTYDSRGRLIRADFENSFTTRHEYVYDKNNKLKSKIYYNKDGSKDIENFDEKGNKKGEKHNSYKYDEKNNIIEEIHDYPYGVSKFTFEYKYNELGNWIERKTYFSESKTELGKLRSTELKAITYYP
jgi:hypothetical protein